MNVRTTGAVATALLLAAATALATDRDAARRDFRPCRATNRRLYEELQSFADEDDDGGGGGGGYADTESGGDDLDVEETGDESADDDYSPPPTVGEKPRRGVRRLTPTAQRVKQYDEKKLERPLYPAGLAAAPGMGAQRATNNALLRGETVELPTYVNVPVTLRCRFVPLDGTDDKFETVVEAMYPGHADAPPPPPDSHASQILRQLMGSADGWRGVVNESVRPVRRVVEARFGWPQSSEKARPDEGFDGGRARRGRRPYGAEDVVGRQIAARRLAAAEHQPWSRVSRPRPRLDPRRWFTERRPTVHEQDARPWRVDAGRRTENELIDYPAAERIEHRNTEEDQEEEEEEAEQQEEEEEAESHRSEQVDGEETEKIVADLQVNDRYPTPLSEGGVEEDYRRAVDQAAEAVQYEEKTEDRVSAGGAQDDGLVTEEGSIDELQRPEVTTTGKGSETATTAKSDYAMITRTIPVKTFTEDAIIDPYE